MRDSIGLRHPPEVPIHTAQTVLLLVVPFFPKTAVCSGLLLFLPRVPSPGLPSKSRKCPPPRLACHRRLPSRVYTSQVAERVALAFVPQRPNVTLFFKLQPHSEVHQLQVRVFVKLRVILYEVEKQLVLSGLMLEFATCRHWPQMHWHANWPNQNSTSTLLPEITTTSTVGVPITRKQSLRNGSQPVLAKRRD
jgi:hypothetical protein